MSDKLHQQIMNLPCKYEAAWQAPAPSDWIEGYVNGHRDTRHAAAELVAAAAASRDAEVQRLREALDRLCEEFVRVFPVYYYAEPWAHDRNEALIAARAALKEQQ